MLWVKVGPVSGQALASRNGLYSKIMSLLKTPGQTRLFLIPLISINCPCIFSSKFGVARSLHYLTLVSDPN